MKAAKKMGRPSKYTPEQAVAICERIRKGEWLHKIAGTEGLPPEATLYRWLDDNEDFRELYARAREDRTDRMAAEMLEIADDSAEDTIFVQDSDKDGEGAREVQNHEWINRSRLRVDARKWLMSKLAPKRYGDKITQEITGKDGAPLVPVINIGPKPDNK